MGRPQPIVLELLTLCDLGSPLIFPVPRKGKKQQICYLCNSNITASEVAFRRSRTNAVPHRLANTGLPRVYRLEGG